MHVQRQRTHALQVTNVKLYISPKLTLTNMPIFDRVATEYNEKLIMDSPCGPKCVCHRLQHWIRSAKHYEKIY